MNAAEASKRLIEARRTGVALERLPIECRPTTLEDAYAIQEEISRVLGPIAGWKVGQADLSSEPFCAPLYASDVYRSGVKLSASEAPGALVEMELAFRTRQHFPARSRKYTAEEIIPSLELLPLIEILSSRFEHFMQLPLIENIADSTANRAVVIGPSVTLWAPGAELAWPITLEIDGAIVHASTAKHASVDPLSLVVWQVNFLAEREGLMNDQIVTTGSLIRPVPAGKHIAGKWEGIGEVRVVLE